MAVHSSILAWSGFILIFDKTNTIMLSLKKKKKSVLVHKTLRWLSNFPDRFTWTPTAMHRIVYSPPSARGMGSLRYSNSIEPLGELESVRIKLVKDFIDE